MANWSDLKAAIAQVIRENGNQEITGIILQNALNSIISNVGKDCSFAGIANPKTTPGIPDGNIFYLATQAGIYVNFNGIKVNEGEAVIFEWRGNWEKKITGFSTQEQLSILNKKVDAQKEEVNAAKEEALKAIDDNEQSAIANFNSQRVTPEMLSESTMQLIEASGGGTITNLADDEDIKSTENNLGVNVLKFADRTYNPINFIGKGYKILRNNIVDSKNILNQEMVNMPNTVYEIRYDFDLNNKNITISENCVLYFNGGILRNGNIILNNTVCISPNIDNETVNISGNMLDENNNKINPIYYWIKDDKLNFRHNLWYSVDGIEASYKKLKKLGFNEFQIFFDLDFETYEPKLNIKQGEIIKGISNIIEYLNKMNFDIRSFKFHNFPADTAAPYMKNIILDLLSHSQFSLVESVFLINENTPIYTSGNYLQYVNVVNEIKRLYPNIDFTFTSSGNTSLFYADAAPLYRLNELGVKGYGINFYPLLCITNKNTGSLDNLISMFKTFITRYINSFRTSCIYKNLNNITEHIYITETGCNDYENGGFTGGSDTTDKGKINSDNAIIYMNNLIQALKESKYVTSVYCWRCQQWDDVTIKKAINEFSKKNKI